MENARIIVLSLNRPVLKPPICSGPVGLGANRTLTLLFIPLVFGKDKTLIVQSLL